MQSIYTYIHFPCEILLLCNLECCKYTYSLWNIAISHSRMQKIYIFLMKYKYFAFSNAGNIHNPYEILLFCNIECQKYTFSLWNIDILAPEMHAGRPAGGSPETVPTGTQPSAKNSRNPCTKWGGTFRHPINPCIICTFLTPECKKCYKSLHEMHPGLLASRPATTIDISFLTARTP